MLTPRPAMRKASDLRQLLDAMIERYGDCDVFIERGLVYRPASILVGSDGFFIEVEQVVDR